MDIISFGLASKVSKAIEALIGNSKLTIPSGTTAERPTLGVGDKAIRFNTDISGLEEWDGTEWKNISATISAFALKGTDTAANILAMVGMTAEDLWIASDTLDGYVYDGSVWINLGPLKGDTGATGPQGIQGITGNGIASVALTNTVGNTKTYTITFTDTSTTTFDVTSGLNGTNGVDGQDVDHVSKTSGTGTAGTTDTYTVWLDAGETVSAGTFNVYNGADGLGAGDMLKAVYDTTNNGIVDNAELVNGLTVETAVPSGALFTDTVYNDTTITTNVANLTTTVTGHTGLIAGNTNSILQLAKSNASGSFGSTTMALSVTNTPQIMPFSVITQSTNTDRFVINADNTITAKTAGTYTFTSTLNIEDTGGNGVVVPLTFTITDGTTTWYSQVVNVEISGFDRSMIAVNSLVVLPAEATVPATAYITVSCPLANNGDYSIVGFNAILATEKALAEIQNLASAIVVSPVGGISAVTVQSALAELDNGKADVATTLSGYGITDAYTKTETDALHDSLSVASVGQSVSYFLGDTLTTGGNYDLANSPDGDVETIVSKLAVAAGTPYFMERYISDPIGGTTIDSGLWILRTHAAVSADNGVSEIVCRINKRTIKDGTITVTGTGTSRTITATSPIFAAGDANTSVLSATLIETPTETFWISSYTSATEVTATTDNAGYINETAVQLHMYYKLFEATTGEINGATAKLYETQIIQPSFNMLPADSILIAYFARTTSTNKTIRLYKGGTQHYSHIVTPIVYRHNNLKGLNEGDYKHLTTAQLGLVTSALQAASIGVTVQAYNANTTTAGNTFNGVSQLVQTDGTGKLPAIDGSLLTGLSASDVTKLPLAGGTMTGAITSLRETSVAVGASDMDLATGNSFTKTITTTTTLTFSNIPASGQLIVWKLALTNAGAFAVTFPTINWVLPDGTYSTSIATYLAANAPRTALKTSGVDTFIFYTENGGTTVYGKLF